MIYCDVIGCGRKAIHQNIRNPFDKKKRYNLCHRCLMAGKRAISIGEKQITEELLNIYYRK